MYIKKKQNHNKYKYINVQFPSIYRANLESLNNVSKNKIYRNIGRSLNLFLLFLYIFGAFLFSCFFSPENNEINK